MQNLERYAGKAAACAAFLFLVLAYPVTALPAVDISPVLVELGEQHNKDVIRITNSGDAAKSFEVNVVAWSQSADEREIYTPSDELLAVPPLFTLQPGEQQLVRLGLMRHADAETELSYRVFFTELAPPETEERTTSGINVRLRFGIPVFVAPLAAAAPAVQFVGLRSIGDNTFMELRNTGNVRVKVGEVRYQAPASYDTDVSPAVFYLHAGRTGYLPLQLPDDNTGGTVELSTDTAGMLRYVLAGPSQ
jgi:fimbrial chaperone protein